MALPARQQTSLLPRIGWPGLAWALAIVATAVGYYQVTSTIVSLVLLALLAVLCWRQTALAVALAPLAMPLYRLPKNLQAGRQLSFSLGETVIVLLVGIVVVQQTLAARNRAPGQSLAAYFLPVTPFLWPAALFLVAAAIATARAHFHTVALREYREVVVEPVLFYWLVLQRLRGGRDAAVLALSLVATGTVICALGAWELAFRTGDLINAHAIGERFVNAVYQDENSLAMLIDRALPMAMAMAVAPGWVALFTGERALQASGREVVGYRPAQGALALCGLLMAYVLYRTGSRGGEATTLLCAAVLVAFWQRRNRIVLIGGLVAAAVAAVLVRHRISSFVDGSHGLSNGAHQSVWHSALRMLRDHPLFGVGPDNFLYYYSNDPVCAPGHIANFYYSQDNQTNFERCISHPHNMFLDFWLSTGVLGLAAWLLLLALLAVFGLQALRSANAERRGPLAGALLVVLAMVVHGEVDNSYFLPDMAVIFWLCAGIVTLCHPAASDGAQRAEQARSSY